MNKDDSNKTSEIGIVLEHIDDKVSLIAEQYGNLNKKVDKIGKKLDTIADDVEIIKLDIEFIKH